VKKHRCLGNALRKRIVQRASFAMMACAVKGSRPVLRVSLKITVSGVLNTVIVLTVLAVRAQAYVYRRNVTPMRIAQMNAANKAPLLKHVRSKLIRAGVSVFLLSATMISNAVMRL